MSDCSKTNNKLNEHDEGYRKCKSCGGYTCSSCQAPVNLSCNSCQAPIDLPCPPGVPRPFLSSYMEALGNGQTVATNGNVVFDVTSLDNVGNNIVLNSAGTVFTIHRTGLYLVEWSLNLASATAATVVGLLENGAASSGFATSTAGSYSAGALIYVRTVPFTIALHNFGNPITLVNPTQWENTAASIRILRFADGPSR